VIERPQELRGLDVNHGDVIRHAVEHVNATSIALENVAVLLGNSVMLDGATLDKAFSILDSQPDVDSCMTVWKAVNDHPERAMGLVDGALTAYQGGNTHVTTEHEAYPAAYYFDQGAWIFRKETVSENSGPGPWWWMGKKCVPIVRPWIQGRDVHRYFDLLLAEWWVQNEEKIARINSAEKS
jgi:N-acylneuraminate cytidylyltransferase